MRFLDAMQFRWDVKSLMQKILFTRMGLISRLVQHLSLSACLVAFAKEPIVFNARFLRLKAGLQSTMTAAEFCLIRFYRRSGLLRNPHDVLKTQFLQGLILCLKLDCGSESG